METSTPSTNGNAKRKVDRTVDKAASRAHDSIDQASDTARPAVDRAAGRAHNAVDRASSAAANAADRIEEKSAQWLEAEQEMMGEVKTYVRDNPLQAVGMAVAAGFLLSRIISSR